MKNKTGLIISREYFTRVKKKSFLLITILVPLIIVAFYALIIAIAVKGGSNNEKIAVIDQGNLLDRKDSTLSMKFIDGEDESSFVKKYKEQQYDAFLYIPKVSIDSPAGIVLHSAGSVSMPVLMKAERSVNKAIEDRRLQASGIKSEDYEKIASDISIKTVDDKNGNKSSMAGVAYAVSFACGIMIYMMMIIYGTQVMRGVMEEKTSRIAEVIVSSVKPFQLMLGKIIGIGAVGLTQFAIWIVLIFGLQMFIPLIFPDLMHQIAAANAGKTGVSSAGAVIQSLSALPLLKIGLSFMFYFLGGYLTYASLFAAIGSMATDDQQDTQQLVFPVIMPIVLGFVIMTKAAVDPHSSLAVFGSIFPLTSPVVMMGRIAYEIPVWQILLSMALLAGCFLFFAWLAAKIYRTGILMYGKKPKWKDMIRYALMKN